METPSRTDTSKRGSLLELAQVFLRLGAISFGGPAAHIAMMEEEVVRKRQWMTHDHFLDLVSATNLIPGPNSTEMTMHCGHERAGWKGLIVAGGCFIFPAVLITFLFAWLYQQYGQLPQIEPYIYGIKPAVLAVIVSALIPLGGRAAKTMELGLLGLATVVACLFGLNEILALLGCGIIGLLLHLARNTPRTLNGLSPLVLSPVMLLQSNTQIFWVFLKIGALLYGSGYVLFAFLDAELVNRGLLSRQVLIDAVAVGQFTPGPILSTATFIGWQMHGFTGALAATLGVFLPSFLFVALLNPLIPKLRKSATISAALDAVNVASVAVIGVVCIEMARTTLTDWRAVLIAALALSVVFAFKKTNSASIVLGGAVLGYLLRLL